LKLRVGGATSPATVLWLKTASRMRLLPLRFGTGGGGRRMLVAEPVSKGVIWCRSVTLVSSACLGGAAAGVRLLLRRVRISSVNEKTRRYLIFSWVRSRGSKSKAAC